MTRRDALIISLVCCVALPAAALVPAACGSSGRPGGGASPAASPSWTGAPISSADARAVRDRAAGFWAAYNAYDAPRAISYLDGGYRPVKAPVIRSEVGRLKAFGVRLGVSVKSGPVLIAPGVAQMYLSMRTPTGVRTVLMRFAKRGDVWMVTYSEEIK